MEDTQIPNFYAYKVISDFKPAIQLYFSMV